jgi:hypothetical protein
MRARIVGFEWNEESNAGLNFRKHGVRMPEAIPIFDGFVLWGSTGTRTSVQDGKLIDLERQSATIHGKAKYGGFGGIKVASQYSPNKSPMRLPADSAFVVRSALASSAVDPATQYVLRAFTKKGGKRELVMAESHGPLAMGGTDSSLAQGVVVAHFEKYGESSLRLIPEKPLPPGEYAVSRRFGIADLFYFGVD